MWRNWRRSLSRLPVVCGPASGRLVARDGQVMNSVFTFPALLEWFQQVQHGGRRSLEGVWRCYCARSRMITFILTLFPCCISIRCSSEGGGTGWMLPQHNLLGYAGVYILMDCSGKLEDPSPHMCVPVHGRAAHSCFTGSRQISGMFRSTRVDKDNSWLSFWMSICTLFF